MVETTLPRGKKLIPGITVIMVIILAVLAFRNGFGIISPTGLVALENTTFVGTFDITNISVTIPAEHTTVKFSAPQPARIMTKNGEINGSGNFEITDFVGILVWDGSTMQLVGNMETLSNGQVSVRFLNRESTTIILNAGSIEATSANMSIFTKDLTGKIRLENKWTINLDKTPVTLRGYKGKAHFQRINNITTMMLDGNSANARIEQENFLKNVA
ncbi:MAG: hypothetical protein QXF14_04855 [Candidatus Woesearchaeota archaeon]